MFDMSEFGLLNNYDIEIETEVSLENFKELVDEALQDSMIMGTFNMLFVNLLAKAIDSNWNPDEEKLGEFVYRIGAAQARERGEPEPEEIKDSVLLLNHFGGVVLRDESIPFMFFRDKKTGKLLDFKEDFECGFSDIAVMMLKYYGYDEEDFR